jgi:IPT/TIG domain
MRLQARFVLLGVPLVLAAAGVLGTQASAAAPADAFTSSEPCVVRTLPEKFVELSTTGSVADVVEVSCEASLAGSPVTVSARELRSRCNGHLSWVLPYPYEATSAEVIEVRLDADANATVAVFADTCAAGESLVVAHLEQEPFYTATTSFDVLAPKEAPEGVSVIPESEVPNFTHKSIAVVVPVAFEADEASQQVTISSHELFSACAGNVVWVGPGASVLGSGTASAEVQLDYDGRAFVAALAGECATSEDLFSARLEGSPYTTLTTQFFIAEQPQGSPAPRVTAVAPDDGPQSGGSPVTITGANFGGATRVQFGNAEATGFKLDTESRIEADAPPGTGAVFVTVTTPAGTSQRGSANAYTYFPPPTVTKVRPNHGPRAGGTEVTITGHGFANEVTTVRFGNVAAPSVTVHSEASLTATAPAGKGKVYITVTTPGGTSAATRVEGFQYR